MRIKLTFLFLFFMALSVFAQNKNHKFKGDDYFFVYNYLEAINAYEHEMQMHPLTNLQHLKLAESYFRAKDFKKSWNVYKMIYEKDTVISGYHLNKMLRSLIENEGIESANEFTYNNKFFKESSWLENAKFHYKNLNSNEVNNLNFNVFNLSENSPQADYSPSFFNDKLLFASNRTIDKKSSKKKKDYLSIYIAKKGNNGDMQNANLYWGISKGNYHLANPYYSKELGKLFYVLSNQENGELVYNDKDKNSMAIGVISNDNEFSFLLKDLSTSFYYPFYDAASDRLYFAANFKDSYGGTDLYYVNTNKGQIMSAPINLGPRVNTPGNEISPYIFEGGLYFSSDIFYGYGGMDIYKSGIQKDGQIGLPINLGSGLNSKADDFGFIVQNNTTGGLEGYFSSNREGGKGNDDIYGFRVENKPTINTTVFKGRIIKQNSTIGISDVSIKIINEDNSVVKEVTSDNDGNYFIEVPWQDNIKVHIKKRKYASLDLSYTAKEHENATSNNGELTITMEHAHDFVEEKENQKVIKLNKFFFDRNKSEINSEVALELDKVVAVIKKFPSFNLRIESHSNSKYSHSTNFKLTQKRSDAIKEYLLSKGVPAKNILFAIGYGEDQLLNHCKNGVFCADFAHKENERSLIVVLNYDEL